MRVGIDAGYLLERRRTGVETYVLNLMRALLALGDRPEIVLYAAGADPPDAAAEPLFAAADRFVISRRTRLWLRLRLPLRLALERVSVAHFPGSLLPAFLPCPAVTTFYDLAAFRFPALYDPRELALYETVVPRSAQRSTRILAISEQTRGDLIELFGVPAERIDVTPLGVDPIFRPIPDAAAEVARHGLRAPYVLCVVGSGHPRKNLCGAVEAFSRLDRGDLELAVVGEVSRDPAAVTAIEASPARERIRVLGHVDEAALPALYSAATVFCFPSLYEGFGLPVIEAMACGAPVVCSDLPVLRELAAGAAVLVRPGDADELTTALREVVEDAARRTQLAAAGPARAAQYTWERTARLTLDTYRAAAEQGGV